MRFHPRPAVAALLLALGVAVFGMAPPVGALPAAYSAAEIRGSVVDAETKQPLEGVHVVAQWILQTGVIHGEHIVRLQILEAVTDAAGQYYLPAWGSRARPPSSRLEWGYDPTLLYFKPGYVQLVRHNYDPPPLNEPDMSERISVWNGRTIELKPFRGTPDTWAGYLSSLQTGLAWGEHIPIATGPVNDYWKQMPRMVLAIVEQRNLLPGRLTYLVQDLAVWHVTEAQLRAAQ